MRNPKTEAQLATMAAAADRGNRPTIVVVIAVLLTLGSAVYAGISYFGMQTQGRRLRDTLSAAEDAEARLKEIKDLRGAEIDLAEVLPNNEYLAKQIRDYATAALEDAGLEAGDISPVDNKPRRIFPSDPVSVRSVRVALPRRPLPVLLDFLSRVVNDPDDAIDSHQNLYIGSLRLTPDAASDSWMLDVQFEMLVYVK